MDLKQNLNKKIWIALIFSIALNLGFLGASIVPVIKENFFIPEETKRPAIGIIKTMDLELDKKKQLIDIFHKMHVVSMDFTDELEKNQSKLKDTANYFGEEKRKFLIDLFVKRGEIIKKYGAIIAGQLVEVDELIGEENSRKLFEKLSSNKIKGFKRFEGFLSKKFRQQKK